MVLATAPVTLRAQHSRGDLARDADSYMSSLKDAHDFSGSVLIARNARILFQRSYGFANREQGRRIASGTRFAIGSITKSFTAAAVLRLAQRGRLSLADPIARYLPEIGHG